MNAIRSAVKGRMHSQHGSHHPLDFKPPLEMLKRMARMQFNLKRGLPLTDNLAELREPPETHGLLSEASH